MRIECNSRGNRSGFVHEAMLISSTNQVLMTAKIQYINRTWEQFQFQSVKRKLIAKAIEAEVRKQQKIMGIKRLTKAKREEIINYSSIINRIKSL